MLPFEQQRQRLEEAVETVLYERRVPRVTMQGQRWENHRDNFADLVDEDNALTIAEDCLTEWRAL